MLATVASYLWNQVDQDNLPEFSEFPHAFVATAGHDPTRIVIAPGPLPGPAQLEQDGRILWPAYTCSDRGLVPDRDGMPCVFPLIDDATGRHSPPLPPRGVVLRGSQLRLAQPYLTPEAQAILERFKERMQ